MSSIKTKHSVAALLESGKHVLLVRETSFAQPFRLPGIDYHGNGSGKRELLSMLRKRYEAEVSIRGDIAPISLVNGKQKEVLHVYLARPVTQFSFPKANFEFVYADFRDLPSLYLAPLDKAVLRKYASFYPLYEGSKRTLPLSLRDEAEAREYCRALSYFAKRINASDVRDFEKLLSTDIGIDGIRRAFRCLLDLYGLDLNEYLNAMEYRKAHSRI